MFKILFKKKIDKEWSPDIYYLNNIEVTQNMKQRINNGEFQNLEKDKKSKEDQIKSIISDLKTLLGEQMMITKIWTYKTPLNQKQFTSLIFYHEYVIIEIKSIKAHEQYKIHCSLQKNGQRIWIFLNQSFQGVRDYYPIIEDQKTMKGTPKKRYNDNYWKPIQLKEYQVKCDFYALIQWLYQEQINLKKYHFTRSNCKFFASSVVRFVRKRK